MAESGFSRPDLPNLISTIRSDILTRMEADVVLRRLDAEVYGRVMAAAVHTLYGYLDYLAKNMLPDQADEEWLLRHGNLKQVIRKQPTEAAGFMRWDTVGSVITIPNGTSIQTDTQTEYITTADATTDENGTIRAPVEAVEPGSAGNLDDGTALRLMSPIQGLSSTGYAEDVEGGTDLEGLEEWRARIMARWYYTPQGGADADYKIWATDVAGITRAWVFRHYSGRGTVGVMVANSNASNPAPDATLVEAVREYILPLAPVAGAGLTVFAPKLNVIDMDIALAKDTPAIRAAVVRELNSALLRDGVPGGKIYRSRLSEAISLAAGEMAHRLTAPEGDVQLGAEELPVLGAITWSSYSNIITDLTVVLNSFGRGPGGEAPGKFHVGESAAATASITPLPEGVTVSYDFWHDPDDPNDIADPTQIVALAWADDGLSVTATGRAPGTVYVQINVKYNGKTWTDHAFVTVFAEGETIPVEEAG